jgi:DNA-directed RNA polymerase subunit RPC12/RpoP
MDETPQPPPPEECPGPRTLAEMAEAARAKSGGLKCRRCGGRLFVRNTVHVGNQVRRYRVCAHCGYIRRTVES